MFQHDLHQYLDFRPLLESDLDSVLAIEMQNYQFPWSEKIFRDCIKSDYQCFAILLYQKFSGYLIVSSVLDEAHLLNISLSEDSQAQGLGTTIMFWLIEQLSNQNIRKLFLEVRPSNLKALTLYNRIGFDTVGLRKAYYPLVNGREDAIVMMLSI
jgi:ribosomal-protein-alanine N-acetyltransferase